MAEGDVTTVRAAVRTWRHWARREAAFARAGWTGWVPFEAPETTEAVIRVWLAPDGAREEGDGGEVTVRRGSRWWRYDPASGARSNEGMPRQDPEPGELDWPRRSPSEVGLCEVGEPVPCRRAGRAARAVRAEEDAGRDQSPFVIEATIADEVLLEVDAERGTLLRLEARSGGAPFEIAEVLEIAYDETFPDETFVFAPPRGVEVRSIAADHAVLWDLTLEQAAGAAPFALWVPAEDWEVKVAYARTEDEPPMSPQVHLHYVGAGVRIAQSPAIHPAAMRGFVYEGAGPWRELQREGRTIEVREHVVDRRPAEARLELDGTQIVIHSAVFGADALADVAAGLRRAG